MEAGEEDTMPPDATTSAASSGVPMTFQYRSPHVLAEDTPPSLCVSRHIHRAPSTSSFTTWPLCHTRPSTPALSPSPYCHTVPVSSHMTCRPGEGEWY